MIIRKVLLFGTILGLTLPKKYTSALDLNWQDYVEVYLANDHTIVIKKHDYKVTDITLESGQLPK